MTRPIHPREFERLFPNASKDARAVNNSRIVNHPAPEIPDPKPKKQAQPLAGGHAGKAPCAGRPFIVFKLRRVRLLDWDAKYGSIKDLLDGLQYAGLIQGDREDQISGEVIQEKVRSYKEEETIIQINYP